MLVQPPLGVQRLLHARTCGLMGDRQALFKSLSAPRPQNPRVPVCQAILAANGHFECSFTTQLQSPNSARATSNTRTTRHPNHYLELVFWHRLVSSLKKQNTR